LKLTRPILATFQQISFSMQVALGVAYAAGINADTIVYNAVEKANINPTLLSSVNIEISTLISISRTVTTQTGVFAYTAVPVGPRFPDRLQTVTGGRRPYRPTPSIKPAPGKPRTGIPNSPVPVIVQGTAIPYCKPRPDSIIIIPTPMGFVRLILIPSRKPDSRQPQQPIQAAPVCSGNCGPGGSSSVKPPPDLPHIIAPNLPVPINDQGTGISIIPAPASNQGTGIPNLPVSDQGTVISTSPVPANGQGPGIPILPVPDNSQGTTPVCKPRPDSIPTLIRFLELIFN
jgi:hypothetical protein